VKAQLEAAKSPTVHPLVRTHPETGTKAVWFHKAKTETVTGMSPKKPGFSAGFDRIGSRSRNFAMRTSIGGRSADHR